MKFCIGDFVVIYIGWFDLDVDEIFGVGLYCYNGIGWQKYFNIKNSNKNYYDKLW